MRLTDTTTTIPRTIPDPANFKPGDRLTARIVGMTASGRANLQLAGFRALTDRPLGGRVGDVARFEVVSEATTSRAHAGSGEADAAKASRLANPRLALVIRLPGRTVHLNVILKTVLPRNQDPPTDAPQARPSRPASMPLDMATVIQTGLPLPAARAMAAWLRRLHQAIKPGFYGHHGAPQKHAPAGDREGKSSLSDMREAAGRRSFRNPEAPPPPFFAAGLHLDGTPVQFRLRQHRPKGGAPQASPVVEASFLLWPEQAGAMRIDIRMGRGTLAVVLGLADDDCRQRYARALPDLQAALAPLAAHCDCRIQVAPRHIQAFFDDDRVFEEKPDGEGRP